MVRVNHEHMHGIGCHKYLPFLQEGRQQECRIVQAGVSGVQLEWVPKKASTSIGHIFALSSEAVIIRKSQSVRTG